MNTRDNNIAVLSTTPPLRRLSAEEIYAGLEESRKCFEKGDYSDFDEALDEMSKKYGL